MPNLSAKAANAKLRQRLRRQLPTVKELGAVGSRALIEVRLKIIAALYSNRQYPQGSYRRALSVRSSL